MELKKTLRSILTSAVLAVVSLAGFASPPPKTSTSTFTPKGSRKFDTASPTPRRKVLRSSSLAPGLCSVSIGSSAALPSAVLSSAVLSFSCCFSPWLLNHGLPWKPAPCHHGAKNPPAKGCPPAGPPPPPRPPLQQPPLPRKGPGWGPNLPRGQCWKRPQGW